MRYKLPNGQIIGINQPFTYEGTSYSDNWTALATQEQKDALGLTEIPEYPRPDDQFYMVTQNDDGTYNATPKDLDALKKHWAAYFQMVAHNTLLQTDWMIIRKIERNVDVPEATTTYRQAVIAECTRLVTAITGATDVPALIAVVTTQNFPSTERANGN
jgi:hypothetical protein